LSIVTVHVPVGYDTDALRWGRGSLQPGLDVSGSMKCKRLEFKLDGTFLVISDNQRYESETVKQKNESVRVCGKVIGWFHLHRY
jgi:hypothetical protein